jgi:hypothetical protein
MKRIPIFLAGLALSVITAPLAHADQGDDAYLSAVAALGINTSNGGALIAAGHATCDTIGNPFGQLGVQGQLVSAGVPYGQITPVEVAAARVWCPDKLHAAGLS